jgi:hypothetical protein
MTLAHYRIFELDSADRLMDGYSVMCRSDAAALAMACNGECPENGGIMPRWLSAHFG